MLKISYEMMVDKLRKELERTDCLIEAWEKVEILRKKNGEEFKSFSKNCVKGATINKCFGWSDLTVVGTTENEKYIYDDIRVNDFTKGEALKLKTPAQIRESIRDKVIKLRERKYLLEKEIEESRQVYDVLDEKVKELAEILDDIPYNSYEVIVDSIPNPRSLRGRR